MWHWVDIMIEWEQTAKVECGIGLTSGSIGDRLPKLNVVLFEFASKIEQEQTAEIDCSCEFTIGIYRG